MRVENTRRAWLAASGGLCGLLLPNLASAQMMRTQPGLRTLRDADEDGFAKRLIPGPEGRAAFTGFGLSLAAGRPPFQTTFLATMAPVQSSKADKMGGQTDKTGWRLFVGFLDQDGKAASGLPNGLREAELAGPEAGSANFGATLRLGDSRFGLYLLPDRLRIVAPGPDGATVFNGVREGAAATGKAFDALQAGALGAG